MSHERDPGEDLGGARPRNTDLMVRSGAKESSKNLNILGEQGAKPRLGQKITSYFEVIGVREGLIGVKANDGGIETRDRTSVHNNYSETRETSIPDDGQRIVPLTRSEDASH